MRNIKRGITISYLSAITLLLISCVKPAENKELLYEGDAFNMNNKSGEVISCSLGKGPIRLKERVKTLEDGYVWSIYMKSISDSGLGDCRKEKGQLFLDAMSIALNGEEIIDPTISNK